VKPPRVKHAPARSISAVLI